MWTTDGWYQSGFEEGGKDPQRLRAAMDLMLSNLHRALPEMDRRQVVQTLVNSNRQRLDAVPDLKRFPELRGMRALVEAHWRGVRDGAKLDDAHWATYCDYHFYYHRYVAGRGRSYYGGQTGTGKCSYIYFPTSDHGPLLANNLDSSPDEPFGPPHWPMISEHLIWGGVSSGIYMDEQSPEIFPAPVSKLVARYCRGTIEAVEMLTRYTDFWGPGNAILVDRENRIAMIEKSARRIGVRWSNDGFGFITAMTAEDPAFRAHLDERRRAYLAANGMREPCNDTDYWKEADHRRHLMRAMIEEAKPQPTLDKIRAIMQYRGERGKVCYNGERLKPDAPPCEHTLRTTVWVLNERRAIWWPKEGDRPSFQSPPQHVTFESAWRWESGN